MREQNRNKNQEIEEILEQMDLSQPAPETEPMRQYWFMKKARELVKEQSEKLGRPLTACTTTFGCQMNARDSEKLLGVLEQIGYQEETNEEDADFVIYNTCTVRENANMRVYGRLGQLNRVKKQKPHMLIGLCGCMMQEPEVVEKIKKSYRFVDLIFGTHNIYKFAELIVIFGKIQTRLWKISRVSGNFPSNPVSILCLAVTTSVATVSCRMCVAVNAAEIRKISSVRSKGSWQMAS